MQAIAERIAAGTILLLIMPLTVWLSGWQWAPGGNQSVLKVLYWVTETVTQPWGVITHVVLYAWFLLCLRYRLKPALMLFAILAVAILIGQGIKSVIKNKVQEPRPFVAWLEKTHHIPTNEFYNLKRTQRSELVKAQMEGQLEIPGWLRQHWQFETGFGFPSGHTMFAASWALVGVGLLWPRRRTFTLAVLLLWATGVMVSRLLLGMHWPRDLAVATIISALLVILATWLAQRWCGPLTPPSEEGQEIAERSEKA